MRWWHWILYVLAAILLFGVGLIYSMVSIGFPFMTLALGMLIAIPFHSRMAVFVPILLGSFLFGLFELFTYAISCDRGVVHPCINAFGTQIYVTTRAGEALHEKVGLLLDVALSLLVVVPLGLVIRRRTATTSS